MSDTGSVFVLDTVAAPWKGSFSSIGVELYRTKEKHTLRSHTRRRKRQATASTTPQRPTTTSEIVVPEPTEVREQASYHLDLNKGAINERLIGSENSTFQLTCKNCSTFGTLDFSFTEFRIRDDENPVSNGRLDLADFFEGAEMTVVANGMGARMELLTNITGSNAFGVPLFEIPLGYGVAVSTFCDGQYLD